MAHPVPTLIYHITHIENLPLILQQGGLLCKRGMEQGQVACTSIAYDHIQDRRDRRLVSVGPRGNLHHYVPFYFAYRSPMLFAIYKGNVKNRKQEDILYFVSSVQAAQEAGVPFVFTDLHAVLAYASYYTALNDLNHIDWPLMRSKMWNDTPQDPNREARRQAEFLVHNFFPLTLVHEIGVFDRVMYQRVKELLEYFTFRPDVIIRRNWYY